MPAKGSLRRAAARGALCSLGPPRVEVEERREPADRLRACKGGAHSDRSWVIRRNPAERYPRHAHHHRQREARSAPLVRVDKTCPISTEGWMRRVHFVREAPARGAGPVCSSGCSARPCSAGIAPSAAICRRQSVSHLRDRLRPASEPARCRGAQSGEEDEAVLRRA